MRFESFSHMLRHWAEKTPAAPALLYDEHGQKTRSFAALYEAVMRRAQVLKEDGVGCIGILSD